MRLGMQGQANYPKDTLRLFWRWLFLKYCLNFRGKLWRCANKRLGGNYVSQLPKQLPTQHNVQLEDFSWKKSREPDYWGLNGKWIRTLTVGETDGEFACNWNCLCSRFQSSDIGRTSMWVWQDAGQSDACERIAARLWSNTHPLSIHLMLCWL